MKKNLPPGRLGEELATKYLKSQGYKILERNFRIRGGEIDIIVQDPSASSLRPELGTKVGQTLVFVEVKMRMSANYGRPEEAITPWKLKSIVRTAEFYKNVHPELPESLRVDAILIELSPAGEVKRFEHLQNISSG